AVGACILSVAIAAPCAYALAQFQIKGTAVLLFIVLISQMIPGIVIANALYTVYTPIGLINSIPGLILADASQGIPFAILIMRAYLETFPASIVEAARVDGCGHVRAFWSIVLPVSKNSLITAGIFSFLFAWSDFLMALTLTTGETIRPVTLGLYAYIGTNDTDWSAVMTTAELSALPTTTPAAPLRVTVWGGNRHEQRDERVRTLYPEGMHAAIRDGIAANLGENVTTRIALLDEPEHGLTEEVLAETDVLTWWGHMAHDEVSDEVAERVQKHVLSGMGLVVLHSGHWSKPFTRLMGTSCTLRWRNE